MTFNTVCCLWLPAIAFLEYFILKTAWKNNDTFLLAVFCKVVLTHFLGKLTSLSSCSTCLLFLFCEKFLYYFLRLCVVNFKVVTFQHIFYCLCEIIHTQVISTHLLQLMAYAKTESVTYFVHNSLIIQLYIIILV